MTTLGDTPRVEPALDALLADLRELVECESPSDDLAAVERSADLVARLGTERLGARAGAHRGRRRAPPALAARFADGTGTCPGAGAPRHGVAARHARAGTVHRSPTGCCAGRAAST